MRLFQRYVRLFVGLTLFFGLLACGKTDGNAPGLSSSAANLVSYAVTPATTFVPKGSNIQMKATGTYDDGSTRDISAQVSWTTDRSSITAITSSGLMSNSWTGTSGVQVVNVSAAYLGEVKTAKVTIVVATLTSIYVNPNTITINPGSTGTVAVIGNFSDNSNLDVTSSVSWSSSDSAVATGSGATITAGSLGTATLTATYSGRTSTLTVTVSNGSSGGGTVLGTGLKGDYYDGITLEASPGTYYGTRIDSTVDFNWGSGLNNLGQPAYFSIRWSGQVRAEKSETYTFYTQSDDGVRVYIDGVLVINNWTVHATTENVSNTTFNWTANSMHDIVVEYYENYGQAVIQLKWSSATTTKAAVPQAFLYPAP